MPQITALYAGLTALILVALSFRVSMFRLRHNVSYSDGGNNRLANAIRLQANLTEYAPMAMILLLLLELQTAPGWSIHLLGLMFLLGRLLHGVGYGRNPPIPALRKYGMVLTYAMLTTAGITTLVFALT